MGRRTRQRDGFGMPSSADRSVSQAEDPRILVSPTTPRDAIRGPQRSPRAHGHRACRRGCGDRLRRVATRVRAALGHSHLQPRGNGAVPRSRQCRRPRRIRNGGVCLGATTSAIADSNRRSSATYGHNLAKTTLTSDDPSERFPLPTSLLVVNRTNPATRVPHLQCYAT